MRAMTPREKLIDLISAAKRTDPKTGDSAERLADFLLGYGVRLPDYEYDRDYIRGLEEADREGRLLKLPCKLGDAMYRIKRFRRGGHWKKEAAFICDITLTKSNFARIVLGGEYGKTVFRTRKEAEAALEKIKKEGDSDA